MRIRTPLVPAAALAALGLCATRAAADDTRAAPPAATAPMSPPAAAPASPSPAAASEWHRGYLGTVGVGYYERVHVGVAYEPTRTSSVGVFGGTNFGLGDQTTWDLGLAYDHALRKLPGRLEAGLVAKAMYWDQSNPDYDWKMMSLVGGAYLARELHPGLALALDAGVALSFSLDTVRKQNVNYEYPTRWNGSVCLELRYRFDRW